jgi:phosphocarrier protein HPr
VILLPEATVTLRNESGLHARPAKIFAKAAAASTADVMVSKDGREVNGKSVLSVLTLGCNRGDEIVIRTSGDGADATLAELVQLVESGIGESEEG